MKVIEDGFLHVEDFAMLQAYCRNNEFVDVPVGDDVYSTLPLPEGLFDELWMEGHEIITSFVRRSNDKYDVGHNIHSDGIIFGKQADLASVLYVNDEAACTFNGTAFYRHEEYGHGLSEDIDDDFYNKVLRDKGDPRKFQMTDRVVSRPNRMLTYPARDFHGKFPSVISTGDRIVVITFYTKKDEQTER